ncbi:MAG: anthranilate phosphoribosyltransferase [Pseudomonadota bacterium]
MRVSSAVASHIAGAVTTMPATPEIKTLMTQLADGTTLDAAQTEHALSLLSREDASEATKAAFLMALRVRGETVQEITGAANFLRRQMKSISAPEGAVDIVGTGGDGRHTYNISTCAAFVASGAGLKVAKHGNRSVSSKSGASDVLAALGVKMDCDFAATERAIDAAGVGFLWAPLHHPAMKQWAGTRGELGLRSLFNLLGPLCNPAGVKRLVLGVFSAQWVQPIADALLALGAEHAWVVHGADGLDELSTTGTNTVAEVRGGRVTVFELAPELAGLKIARLEALVGGSAEDNAIALKEVLDGAHNAYRDIVLLNAGAALVVGGRATSIAEGVRGAAQAIDGGQARAALDQLIAISNGRS